jgi:hypothetical protein
MPKIEVKTSLKTKENTVFYDVIALKKEGSLHYLENEFNVKVDITENCVKMLRKNSEYGLDFHFEIGNSKCLMNLNDGTTLDIPINTIKLEIEDSKVNIIYLLNEDEFNYLIDIKEV